MSLDTSLSQNLQERILGKILEKKYMKSQLKVGTLSKVKGKLLINTAKKLSEPKGI